MLSSGISKSTINKIPIISEANDYRKFVIEELKPNLVIQDFHINPFYLIHSNLHADNIIMTKE